MKDREIKVICLECFKISKLIGNGSSYHNFEKKGDSFIIYYPSTKKEKCPYCNSTKLKFK